MSSDADAFFDLVDVKKIEIPLCTRVKIRLGVVGFDSDAGGVREESFFGKSGRL